MKMDHTRDLSARHAALTLFDPGIRDEARGGGANIEALAYSARRHRALKPLAWRIETVGVRGRFEIGCQACSSSSNTFASFRSRVSKPSVNQK